MVVVANGSDVEWDSIADVVVVGSGAAALSAAVTAADAGASVVVLERDSALGGTTGKSGGSLWIPSNSYQPVRGCSDSHDDAVRYIARLADPQHYNAELPHLGLREAHYELIETFCRRGTEAVDALVAMRALHVMTETPDGTPIPPIPDYQSDLPENKGIRGRTIRPGWPSDEEIPVELGGGEYTPLIGGMLMVETMRRAAEGRGADIRLENRVVDVVVDDDERVVGVLSHARRRAELIGARKGVVFGSGGFLMSETRSHEFLRGPVFGGCATHTNEGDLVEISSRLGVELANMTHAWWDQVVLEVALRNRSTSEDVFIAFGDSMVQVNKYGRRVVNEKQIYNERGQAHFVWDPSALEYPNLLLFQIWDEAVASDPTKTPLRCYVPYPGDQPDYVLRAETLEGLAEAIDDRLAALTSETGGVRLDDSFSPNLHETVRRFNNFAKSGIDEDFRRGGTDLQVIWQGKGRDGCPNPCMAPIADHGPYYAMILAAGALDTKGGPRINVDAQILRADGTPVPGLYGAGNCVASPMGQGYPGGGGTIGPAVAFGYIAGRHVAAQDAVDL